MSSAVLTAASTSDDCDEAIDVEEVGCFDALVGV